MLSKKSVSLHVAYGKTFTNNLFIAGVDLQRGANVLRLDLSCNLKTRNEFTNTYEDAIELIERIDDLELIEFSDDHTVKNLERTMNSRGLALGVFDCVILLDKEYSMKTKLRIDDDGDLQLTFGKRL